ncbi:MAG: hypothetical protein P8Z79_18045 [Sedimentisphaerales bacterium]
MMRQVRALAYFGWLVLSFSSMARSGEWGTPVKWQDHELPHVSKSHEELIAARRHEYTIQMGGTVDMDHALTREYATWHVGWQPNESLTIENVGSVPAENCKVIINGRGDWYSMDGLLHEAIGTAKNDQEKVYLIWNFLRSNRHHDDPLQSGQWGDELHDPVKMLAIYGAGLCDDSGSIGASMYWTAGFREPEPFVRALHGHMMCEVFAEGRWQFMDIDQNVFYLDRENKLPVSGDTIAGDHDLAHRETHYGPSFTDWTRSHRAAALFGRDDDRSTRLAKGYEIRVNLRPAERIEYRWDNIGKWSMSQPNRQRRWVGNSRKIYQPTLRTLEPEAQEAYNVSPVTFQGRPAIAAETADSSITYRMSSAFVFCGGSVTASFNLHKASDQAYIEAWATDNKGEGKTEPVMLWQANGPGPKRAQVTLDEALNPTSGPPEYEYWVRVRLSSKSGKGAAVLTSLSIRGDIMVSPIFLPRLRLGENQVVYSDESGPDRKVRVTYKWRETTATKPLPAPKLIDPPNRQTLHDEMITYKWQPVEGAGAYHFQVSRDPAMRWPYRPSFDVVYKKTEYCNPFWGIYSPGEDYYWRVRAQNDKGIWSNWSEVRTFRWDGPCVPKNVKLTHDNGKFTLSWEPNPRGRRPVAYEVYGSDIKGFSVSKDPYEIETLGMVPSSYLGRTTSTQMVVAGLRAAENVPTGVENPDNLNRCYYRVVAIDEHGTRSGCSTYAELPHPYIWTKPPTTVQAGKEYRYQPCMLHSMGDMQFRYTSPNCKFWEHEQLSFALLKAPQWLKIDPETGLLTGTAPANSPGRGPVSIQATATFEKRTGKDTFTDDLPPLICTQDFELTVHQ